MRPLRLRDGGRGQEGSLHLLSLHGLQEEVPRALHPRGDSGGKFTELLRGISFSKEVLAWVTLALRESHADQKKVHDDATARLQREHRRAQERIDTLYLDKLDGRIDAEFFDRKAAEWRTGQARILSEIHAHGTANQNYIEGGIRLLELAQRAPVLFERQPASEKRRLLDFVL